MKKISSDMLHSVQDTKMATNGGRVGLIGSSASNNIYLFVLLLPRLGS